MNDPFALDGPRLPAQSGNPDSLVILLHGLGSDGNDLIGLAPYWAPQLPNTAFVSPNAPFPCDMAPYGHQWFSLQDRSPNRILAGVQAAAPILDAFITQELERYGIDESRLALVGFSQGCMMSLYVAPRREKPVAQVLGYSGRLIGTADEVVPFDSLAASEAGLKAAGIPVETLSRPGLAHSIDERGLQEGGKRLVRAFRHDSANEIKP
jgi:phospholipase/carboxylesterase